MTNLSRRLEDLERKSSPKDGFNAIVLSFVEPSETGPVTLEPRGFTVHGQRYERQAAESVDALIQRVTMEASRASASIPVLEPIL